MDELVNFAVEQAALEGPGGCTIARLEKAIEEQLPVAGFSKLTPWVTKALWSALLEQIPRVQFTRSPARSRAENRANDADDELVTIKDLSTIKKREAVDVEGISLVASQAVRDSALGLFDDGLSTFKISDVQRTVLEILGRRRKRGALRTELAKMLNMEASRFHYVLKLLEARSLIILNPILSSEGPALNHSVLTAIVHLRRFAPRLEPGQVFKEVKGSMQAGVYGVSDDNNKQMKRILDCLAAARDGTLVESELKSALGFKLKFGHRSWRRLKQSLEKSGHIRVFTGTLSEKSKPRKFVTLLKAWKGPSRKDAKVELDDDEDADAAEPGGMDMVAEQGLDWQVINLLIEKGEDGMHKHKLCRQLGISMKKLKKRLDDIKKRFGIQETDEQDGKQVVKKWRAPDSMLLYQATVSAPPQPPQGWLHALADARSSPEESPAPQAPTAALLLPGPDQASTAQDKSMVLAVGGGEGDSADGQAPALDLRADMLLDAPPNNLTAGLINQPALDGMLKADHVPEEEIMLLPPLPEGEVANAEGMPELLPAMFSAREAARCSFTNLGVSNPDTLKVKATVLALDRLERLAAKVNTDRFILKTDLPGFFRERERTGGAIQKQAQNEKTLDRRTILRIVDRGVAQGRMQHCFIHAPASKTGDQPQRIEVIIHPDIKLQEEPVVVNEIRRTHKDRQKERYSYPQPSMVDVDTVPVLAGVTRLRAGASNDADPEENAAQRKMMENGFIVARMVRVRLLHMIICKTVGLAGYGEAGPHNALEQAIPSNMIPEGPILGSAAGPLFPFGDLSGQPAAGPSGTVHQAQIDQSGKEALEQLAEEHVGLFTLHALWNRMPLDIFLQCVGSALRYPEIPQLIEEKKTLGELSMEQQSAICDIHAKKRLTSLLDVLRRMDLIRPFIFSANTHYSRSERSVFVAKALVSFQEPAGPGDTQEAGSLVTREFDLRSEEDLDNYWARLEFVCMSKPAQMKIGLPGRVTPELLNPNGWNTLKLMNLSQWMALKERLDAEVETVDWMTCRKIANELNLSYEQVMRIAQSWRARERKDRQRAGAPELPNLPFRAKEKLTPMERLERLRIKAEQRQDRYQKAKLGWHYGVPSRAVNAGVERPWAKKPLMLDASQGVSDGEDNLLMEDDDEGGQALPSRLVKHQRTKKFRWKLEEDRALLQGYIRWHAQQGFQEHAYRVQQRPVSGTKLTERQAHRRIENLKTAKETEDLMRQMNELLESVHKRAHEAACKLQAEDLERQRIEKVERDRARLSESRKRQREQKRRARLQGLMGSDAEQDIVSGDEEMKTERPPPAAPKVARLQELPSGQLFAIDTEEDRAVHERVHELIEDILAAAPYRASGKPARIRGTGARQWSRRQSKADEEGDKKKVERLTPASAETVNALVGPRPGTIRGHSGRTLEQQLQRVVSRRSQSRNQLLGSKEQRPTPPVAAAIELTKSLLWLADSPQGSSADSGTALAARFTDAQISEAFAHLRRRNFVYHGGSRKRFHLAADFKSQLQVVDLHPDLFAEAAAARRQLEALGGSLIVHPCTEVPSGQVAELLALTCSEATDFILPLPKAGAAAASSSQEDPSHGLNQRSIQPIPFAISATVTQPPSRRLPPGITRQPAADTDCLLPVRVAADLELTEEARQLAVTTAEGEAAKEGPELALSLTSVWRALQEAASEGLTRTQAATVVAEPHSSPGESFSEPQNTATADLGSSDSAPAAVAAENLSPSASSPFRPEHGQAASAVLGILERHGLVRRVAGFEEWAFVAVQHSGPYLIDTPATQGSPGVVTEAGTGQLGTTAEAMARNLNAPEGADGSMDLAAEVEGTSAPASEGGGDDSRPSTSYAAENLQMEDAAVCAGSVGGLQEQFLRPWLDHKGKLIESFWRALVKRAMSAVIRAPGISEADLLGELVALNPMSAKQLLAILLRQGLLLVQTVQVAPAGGPPRLFHAKQPLAASQEVRHYFADQQRCFSGTHEVLPW